MADIAQKIKTLQSKTWRVRRHFAALQRYATLKRLKNIAVVESERVMGREKLSGYPYMLIIDPLNVCNLKCPLCPTGRGELPLENGRMKFDRFENLIDQIAPHTLKIMLYNWGEPFLHKDILKFIRHAHDHRISTALSSNLNFLPKDGGAEGIVEAGLDDMIISCDGLSQKTYEKYRVGGNVKTVFQNMREVARAKKRLGKKNPVIEFQFLVFEHNEHEIPRVEKMARKYGADFVRIMPPFIGENEAGIKPARDPEYRKHYNPEDDLKPDVFVPDADLTALAEENKPPLSCFWPWRSMVINWNGEIDPCCFKNYHRQFGNVFETPFDQIWNSDVYRYSRRWITGKAENDPDYEIVCRGCSGYH